MSKTIPKTSVAKLTQMLQSITAKSKTPVAKNPSRPRATPKPSKPSNRNQGQGRLGLASTINSGATTRLAQIIEEDEYIAEVNGSVAFATTQYPCNIGQSSSFPWGSKIALLYEKYSFEYLEYYYKREVSEFSTNGQAGKVMLSFDYDASDSPPGGKQQVEDTNPHIDGMPCIETIRLRIDCAALKKQPSVYVRPGLLPANTDVKTYDCGNLYVSTQGNVNTTVVGELRVRYKCCLRTPILENGVTTTGSAGAQMLILSSPLGETAGATTVYNTLFASATSPIVLANGIGASIASTGLITLNPGIYLLELFNLAADPSVSVSAMTLEMGKSATPATSTVFTSGVGLATTNDVSTRNDWGNNGSIVWVTANFGTTIAAQAAVTYSTGVASNYATLRITQL
jgi:hypothetical protein